MNAEAIEKVLALAKPTMVEVHGLQYSTTTPTLVPPPSAPAFTVDTLDGFVKMLEAGIDNVDPAKVVIHVADESTVNLVQRASTDYGKRLVVMTAKPTKGITSFPYFNNWGPQEEFIIGLQSGFQPNADLDKLMNLVSHIDTQSSVKTVDNSVTQAVTVKQGVAFKEEAEIQARRSLKPYRTFRELDQPASDFIFRVKEQGSKFALFEADGGAWKLAAVALVSSWLRNRIGTSETAPLAEIPIVN